MGKKRKRRRKKSPQERAARAQRRAEAASEAAPSTNGEPAGGQRPEPERRRRGGLPSPYPPLGVSLAHGFRPVGASPAVLALAFLSLLAFWGLFVAASTTAPGPSDMVFMMAVPPVHVFADISLISPLAAGAVISFVAVVLITALRALLVGLLLILVHRAVSGEPVDVRASLRRLIKVGPSLFAILAAEVGLVLAAVILLQSFLGGQIGGLLALVVGLYFLAMAPIVVVAEGVPAGEAIRRSFRAARLPGLRHLSLVLLYTLLVLWITATVPGGLISPATPSIGTWAFALLFTYVHAGVLGAFVYRWRAVRDEVPETPQRAPARR